VLDELMLHIEEIEARIARFDARLLHELKDERNTLALLQTLPDVDLMGAARLLVEMGTDMDAFGGANRLASKIGICPGNHECAGKHKSGCTRSVFKSKFQSLVVR
jgi:transposase